MAAKNKPIIKVSVECPHCGFEQMEAQAARSTICRNCGNHFDIKPRQVEAPARPSPQAPVAGGATGSVPGVVPVPAEARIPGGTPRTVKCFDCANTHKVPSMAKTTLCPSCGSYIDLQDYSVTGLSSRSIRTRGHLTVGARGELNCGRAVCGSTVVEGTVRGSLRCEGKATLKCRGKLGGEIEAAHLVIERNADVEFARPVRAGRVEILGRVIGDLICDGQVVIQRKGMLLGNVEARALDVESGAELAGDLNIGPTVDLTRQRAQPEKAQPEPARRETPRPEAAAPANPLSAKRAAARPDPGGNA